MENTSEKLQILYDEQKKLNELLRTIYSDIRENQELIKELLKNFPSCYSCGKHMNPKYLYIATQEDIDNYIDQNDGLNGPEIGEYYCGC